MGVASLIAGLLGEFSQCFWNVIFHNPNQRYVIGIHQYSYRTWEKPCPAMWRAGIPANRMPLPGVWHHWDGILLRCEVGSFATRKWKLPAAAQCMVSTILLVEGQWFIYLVLSPEKIQDVTKSNHIHMVDFRTKKLLSWVPCITNHFRSSKETHHTQQTSQKPIGQKFNKKNLHNSLGAPWGQGLSGLGLQLEVWKLLITRGNNMKPYPHWEVT